MQKLSAWAKAIERQEGYSQGTRSFRNKNPGNLRWTSYTKSLGAFGKDKDNFCIFRTYNDGFAALCQFLRDASWRQLRPYHIFNSSIPYHKTLLPEGKNGDELPELTLLDFCSIYAPAEDSNKPFEYALSIANQLKVTPSAYIKELV